MFVYAKQECATAQIDLHLCLSLSRLFLKLVSLTAHTGISGLHLNPGRRFARSGGFISPPVAC